MVIGSSAIIPAGSLEGPSGARGPTGATGPAGGGPTGAEGLSGATGTYVLYGANEVSESGEDLLVLYLSNNDSVGLTGFKGPTYAYSPGDASGITIGGQFDIFDGHTAGTRIDGTTFWFKGISGEGSISVSLSSDGDTINISGATATFEGDLNDAATGDRFLYLENPFVANSTGITFSDNFINFGNKTAYDVREELKIVGPIDVDEIIGITGAPYYSEGEKADGGIELQVDHGSVYKINTPIGITGFTGAFHEDELFTFSAYVDGNDIWAFPSNIYFETGEVFFSCGNDLVNFMSADAGTSWIATVTSRGYDVLECATVTGSGSCCYLDDEQQPYCEDYVTEDYCKEKPGNSVNGSGIFNPLSSCAENCGQTAGICCVQGECLENVGPDVCDYYGGTFWDCIEPPGGNGDDGVGSCCYQEQIDFWLCEDNLSSEECELKGDPFRWGGNGSVCPDDVAEYCNICEGAPQISICCYFQNNEPKCEMNCRPECNRLGGHWHGCNPDLVSECQCGSSSPEFSCTITACCIPNADPNMPGECSIKSCETCEADGGVCVYDGNGYPTSCNGVVCTVDPVGACCVFYDEDGEIESYCVNNTQSECYQLGQDNESSLFHVGEACLGGVDECKSGICCCDWTDVSWTCQEMNFPDGDDPPANVLQCEKAGCVWVHGWEGCALDCDDCNCCDWTEDSCNAHDVYCGCGDEGLLGGGRRKSSRNLPPVPPVFRGLSPECSNIDDCSSCEAVEECHFCCDPCACDYGPDDDEYVNCGACCLDLGDGDGSNCVLPVMTTPSGEESNGCYSHAQCNLLGGFWTPGVTCGSMDCCDGIPYTGACCCPTCEEWQLPVCQIMTIQECYREYWPNDMDNPNNLWVFMGHGTDCNGTCECFEAPDIGACCLPDESCVDETEKLCLSSGGSWHENESCSQFSCVETAGCCYEAQIGEGTQTVCEEKTETQCVDLDGVWYSGYECDEINCGVIGVCDAECDMEELCCITDWPEECAEWADVYGYGTDYCRGDGTNCSLLDRCKPILGECPPCDYLLEDGGSEFGDAYFSTCQYGSCVHEYGGLGDCVLPILGAVFRTEYECCLESHMINEGPGCRGISETVSTDWYPMPMHPSYVKRMAAVSCICCGYCEYYCTDIDCDAWGEASGCNLNGPYTCECEGDNLPSEVNVCNPEHLDPVQCHCNADVGNGVPAGTQMPTLPSGRGVTYIDGNRHLFVPEIERCIWFDCTSNPDACRDYDDCSDHT
jgi:hypothetical protein